jgi:hypothetical protein
VEGGRMIPRYDMELHEDVYGKEQVLVYEEKPSGKWVRYKDVKHQDEWNDKMRNDLSNIETENAELREVIEGILKFCKESGYESKPSAKYNTNYGELEETDKLPFKIYGKNARMKP